MHLNRANIKKTWPIPRKGTKYIAVATHEKSRGIPLVIILRDLLNVAENRKEVRRILRSGMVFVNGKIRRNEDFPVVLLDILKINDKNYRVSFSNTGKFSLEETKEENKVSKVIGKKILKNKKIQLNTLFGGNILSDKKVNIGDSIIIKDKKISEIIPLEKGKNAIVLSGKKIGRKGKIEEIKEKMVTLSSDNKEIVVPLKNILVIN